MLALIGVNLATCESVVLLNIYAEDLFKFVLTKKNCLTKFH